MMMAKSKPRSTQISVWIDKETRININRLMERDDVHNQADAIALAMRIAIRYLADHGEFHDEK